MKYWRTAMSGTGCWTVFSGCTTSLGSSWPARPCARRRPMTRAMPSSTARLCAAAADSVVHWVRYCSATRLCVGSPSVFSNVMPAAPKPVAGTVSP